MQRPPQVAASLYTNAWRSAVYERSAWLMLLTSSVRIGSVSLGRCLRLSLYSPRSSADLWTCNVGLGLYRTAERMRESAHAARTAVHDLRQSLPRTHAQTFKTAPHRWAFVLRGPRSKSSIHNERKLPGASAARRIQARHCMCSQRACQPPAGPLKRSHYAIRATRGREGRPGSGELLLTVRVGPRVDELGASGCQCGAHQTSRCIKLWTRTLSLKLDG